MPGTFRLNISDKSDDPILEPGDVSKIIKLFSCKNAAFIFLLMFPFTILATEIYLYPFPPQIDAFSLSCDIPDLLSRTDFNNVKDEFDKTVAKLLSIKNEMALSDLTYDTFLGYKIAKEMLEEYKIELESNLKHQKTLWKQCINKNLSAAMIPLNSHLQFFNQQIICLTIVAFFISLLIFGVTRNCFKSESKILFNICFLIQSFFIVFIGILGILASIYYCKIWDLTSDGFLNLL